MKEKKRREVRGGFLLKAVTDMKNAIRIGDSLEIRVGYDSEGKRIQRIKPLKGHVTEKYPHIVELELPGKKISRKTVTYVELLTGEAKWKGETNEDYDNL